MIRLIMNWMPKCPVNNELDAQMPVHNKHIHNKHTNAQMQAHNELDAQMPVHIEHTNIRFITN